jgi:polysaccharide pyruvyl transferase WcaK-like protein
VLKELVRNVLPDGLWREMLAIRYSAATRVLHRQWKAARASLTPRQPDAAVARVLLVPSDPFQIAGSCGDEAMVTAVLDMARAAYPAGEVHVIVWDENSNAAAERLGMVPIPIWNRDDYPQQAAKELEARGFRAAVAMGADVLDGIYGGYGPAKQLVALDIAARLGVPATVLGASFSTRPDGDLKRFFDDLDPRVRICIRDSFSLERAQAFIGGNVELVADSAFMLRPALSIDPDIAAWIEGRRAAGKRVFGFNAHPMLLPHLEGADIEGRLIGPAFEALTGVTAQKDVAWLLIPHDRREKAGDGSVLEPLYARLKPALGEDVAMLDGFRSAAELKATAARMDGVVTGRMHLAIASLGSGVPVMCITYQDKFEGLMVHFGLPDDVLLSVPELADTALSVARLGDFIDGADALREAVGQRLPQVREQARKNFAAFS